MPAARDISKPGCFAAGSRGRKTAEGEDERATTGAGMYLGAEEEEEGSVVMAAVCRMAVISSEAELGENVYL